MMVTPLLQKLIREPERRNARFPMCWAVACNRAPVAETGPSRRGNLPLLSAPTRQQHKVVCVKFSKKAILGVDWNERVKLEKA
jgi:hypothetical protein